MRSRKSAPINLRSSDAIVNIREYDIVKKAAERRIFVEKFGERYARLRKKARRLYRNGLLNLELELDNGFYYRSTQAGESFLLTYELKEEFRRLERIGAFDGE